jgi:hypothetical protein
VRCGQGVAMKRKTLGRWVQACLVGSVVAGGCNRQEVPVARSDGDLLAPVSTWAQKDPRSPTASTKRVDSTIVATSYTAASHIEATPPGNPRPTPNIPPVVFADRPGKSSSSIPVAEAPKSLPPATVSAALPVLTEAAKPARQDDLAMGTGQYGHAEDYTWLRGEVRHTRKGWHLRYASLDETDPHGGSVMLADDGPLSELKDGEIFVVKGRLQDPNSHQSSPAYMVSEIRPAGR